jgi:DNA-binding SARP family transcriptional activator/TolB-like protein/tetratricopeptide (TPR) repeat protein
MTSRIEFRLLGGVELSGAPSADLNAVLAQPKRVALLAYLVINRPAGFTRRDTIVGAFWPELDDAHARNALSQSLRFLRRHLGDSLIVRRSEEEVAVSEQAISCDVDAFEHACARGDHANAIRLYGGDLLAGLLVTGAPGFDLWLEERRSQLIRAYWRTLEGAADHYKRIGDAASAAECWRRRAAGEPHNSAVARKLMLALAAAGDRAGAIEHAAIHARRLAADLETKPDGSIVALADQLRAAPIWRRAVVDPLSEEVAPDVAGTDPREATHHTPNGERDGSPIPPRRVGSYVQLAGLFVAGLVLAAVVDKPTSVARSKRVVVGVFENQTGDTAFARLGTMATDWITQGLQRTGLVEVVPSGTLLPMAHGDTREALGEPLRTLRNVGQVTNAGYIVNGTIQLDGETLRFQPQIIDAASLRLVGAPAAVVVDRADPGRGIENLRQHVMASLASVLDPRVASWAAAASNPPSLAAFSEFQAGLDALVAHHNSRVAIEHFQRAADADSSYVVPRLWMIQALMRIKSVAAPRTDSLIESLKRSRDRLAPADALLLDRLDAIQHGDLAAASRASLQLVAIAPASYFVQMLAEDAGFANRPREAMEILSRLDPKWPWVREWQEYWSLLAYTLHNAGDFDRELDVARQARLVRPESNRFLWLECQALAGLGRVDDVRRLVATFDTLRRQDEPSYGGDFPPDGFYRNVGLELRAHGHADAGRAMIERADAWYAAHANVEAPSVANVHQHMLILAELSRWREAMDAARVVLDSFPNDPMPTAMLGIAAASLGDTVSARAQLALLTSSGTLPDNAVRLYEAAKIAATLGERDRAISLLTSAYAAGRRHTFWDHLAVTFEPLRASPGYRDLMRPRG